MFMGNIGNGLWIAFIGWFLEGAAGSQVRQQTIHDLLANHRVADVMRRDFTVVSPNISLEQLVDEHILGTGQRCLIVEQNGRVSGLLTLHEFKKVPRAEWPTMTAERVMIPAGQVKRVRPDAELTDALAEMDRDGVNQLPVMMNDQIQGIISRDDVINLLRTLSQFDRRQNHMPKTPSV